MAKFLGGKGKVLVIDHPSVSSVQDRTRGFEEALKAFPGITVVDKPSAGGERAKAQAIMEDALTTHADLAGVFGINDNSALGALRAVEAAGRKDVVIIGYDAIPEARAAIRRGSALKADVIQYPRKIGSMTVATIARHFAGEKVDAISPGRSGPGRRGVARLRTMSLLRLHGITKTFPGVRALDAVGFDVRAGEIHALVGENGAGKSTLMKVLGGAYVPDSGSIELDGESLPFGQPLAIQRRGVQIIHQELALVPELTAAENIFLGRERGGPLPRPARDDARSASVARRVGGRGFGRDARGPPRRAAAADGGDRARPRRRIETARARRADIHAARSRRRTAAATRSRSARARSGSRLHLAPAR